MNDLLEVAFGNGRMPIASKDNFALLGDFEVRLTLLRRARQNGPAHWPTTTPNSAAAPMKDNQFNAKRTGSAAKRLLGAIGLPGGRQIAAVFVTIGIADHDLLAV